MTRTTKVNKTEVTHIGVIAPESIITEAAQPLLCLCESLIGYPRAKKSVQKAREKIEIAMQLLDDALAEAR